MSRDELLALAEGLEFESSGWREAEVIDLVRSVMKAQAALFRALADKEGGAS